jgi:hypothetical protein
VRLSNEENGTQFFNTGLPQSNFAKESKDFTSNYNAMDNLLLLDETLPALELQSQDANDIQSESSANTSHSTLYPASLKESRKRRRRRYSNPQNRFPPFKDNIVLDFVGCNNYPQFNASNSSALQMEEAVKNCAMCYPDPEDPLMNKFYGRLCEEEDEGGQEIELLHNATNETDTENDTTTENVEEMYGRNTLVAPTTSEVNRYRLQDISAGGSGSSSNRDMPTLFAVCEEERCPQPAKYRTSAESCPRYGAVYSTPDMEV